MKMKETIKVMIADMNGGECASISEINSESIKCLKQWISRVIRYSRETVDFEVINTDEGKIKQYFEDYIKYHIKKEHDYNTKMIVVGVQNINLVEVCLLNDDIRPLHICQSISCNISNFKTAIREGNKEWQKELLKEKHELYIEAFRDFNLNMSEVNQLMWGEYYHEITDHKFVDYEFKKRFTKTKICEDCGGKYKTTLNIKYCDPCSEDIFDLEDTCDFENDDDLILDDLDDFLEENDLDDDFEDYLKEMI